jgi:hypothetical protein
MIGDLDRRTLLAPCALTASRPPLRTRSGDPRELDRLEKELSVHQEILDEQERRLRTSAGSKGGGGEIESAKSKRRDIEQRQFAIRNNQEYREPPRDRDDAKERASPSTTSAPSSCSAGGRRSRRVDRLQAVVVG